MAPETVTSAAAIVTTAAALAGGVMARGSTAVPAAGWAAAASLALAVEAGCRAGGGLQDPADVASVRLLVVALGVCPAMSLLGAKRPQHGVWQLIVATLACVLAMPAVSAALVRPGGMPDVHVLERSFLPVLVAVGWMNFVGTRRGIAASLVGAGQAVLAWPVVWGGPAGRQAALLDAGGAGLVATGAVLAALQSWRRPPQRTVGLEAAFDRPFLALRETLGAAWTLRIVERFNAVAESRGWPCRLRYGGLEMTGTTGPRGWERDVLRCGRSILRRFVSVDWLERRGGMRPA